MKQFTDRVAVVTGAGSGIGRAICLELARKGADIAAVDIDEAHLSKLRQEVEALDRTCSAHVVDVASREEMESLPAQVIAEHGAVHILVNNAGVSVNLSFLEQGIEDLQWITGINYWGVVYGCKFFLPHLLEQDEAHTVNVSSSAGFTGMKWQTSYGATKFAVTGLSESLFIELAGTNVGISCVHPGARGHQYSRLGENGKRIAGKKCSRPSNTPHHLKLRHAKSAARLKKGSSRLCSASIPTFSTPSNV